MSKTFDKYFNAVKGLPLSINDRSTIAKALALIEDGGGGQPLPIGVNKDILQFDNINELIAGPITPELLSDFDTPSPYEQGVLVYADDPDNPGSKKLGWLNIAIEGAESITTPNSMAIYQPGVDGGQLPVEDSVQDIHAVNQGQIKNQNADNPITIVRPWIGTPSQYDAIVEKEPDVLYYIIPE